MGFGLCLEKTRLTLGYVWRRSSGVWAVFWKDWVRFRLCLEMVG